MKLTFKTLSYSIMTLLVILVYSCQNDDFHTDKVVQPHAEANSYNRVPFSEVITTTPFTTVEKILEMSVNFESKYNPNDYELDSNSFKKTAKSDFLSYAAFLKKKSENNPNIFYNLVLYRLEGQWKKMILKCVKKFDANGHQKREYDTFIVSDETNKTSKCSSDFYTVDLFYCKAGHTDPACPDCSGCWRTIFTSLINNCDQVYEIDINNAGSTGDTGAGGGGGASNTLTVYNQLITGLNSYRSNLYNQLSAENKAKCYEIYSLTQNHFMLYLALDLFTTYPNTTVNQLQPYLNNVQISDYLLIYDVPESYQFASEMLNIAVNEEEADLSDSLIKMSLVTNSNGFFNNNLNSNYTNLIDPYVEANLSDPVITAIWIAQFKTKCAILKWQHPNWSKLKIYWEASKEMIHIGLDIIGLVPVAGEVADVVNGVIYTIEGDGVNATLSYAGAIPFAGWWATSAKTAVKVINTASTGMTALKWTKRADGIFTFGSRSQLRKVLGLLPGNPLQAHHILPWASNISEHTIVQKAAKSSNFFHMNEALNGIAIAAWRNQPNHNAYNNLIKSKLDALPSNLSPNQAYNELVNIINQAKQAIINNPNTHLNDLIF